MCFFKITNVAAELNLQHKMRGTKASFRAGRRLRDNKVGVLAKQKVRLR
jgi:hypothetical protein